MITKKKHKMIAEKNTNIKSNFLKNIKQKIYPPFGRTGQNLVLFKFIYL